MRSVFLSFVFVLFAAGICSAQSMLYFPQFADGTDDGLAIWGTSITITNPAPAGSRAATGTITFTRDDGTPVNVTLVDYYGAPAGSTFQLAGGQTKMFQSVLLGGSSADSTDQSGPGSLKAGYATVTSDLPVSADLGVVEATPDRIIGAAAIQAATPLKRQAALFIKNDSTNTGVAVANPGTATANVTFQLLDASGMPIGSPVTQPLAASNHARFFVPDLFPNAPSEMWGTMQITSDQPIVSSALLFIPGGGFTSLPMFQIQ